MCVCVRMHACVHLWEAQYPSFPYSSFSLQYGGEEHLSAPPKELLLAQTENYVEYSRSGAIVKGQERAKVKSRYEEDVYINNHTVGGWGGPRICCLPFVYMTSRCHSPKALFSALHCCCEYAPPPFLLVKSQLPLPSLTTALFTHSFCPSLVYMFVE